MPRLDPRGLLLLACLSAGCVESTTEQSEPEGCVRRSCAEIYPRCDAHPEDGCGGTLDCTGTPVCGDAEVCEEGCCRQFTCGMIPELCGSFTDSCRQAMTCSCAAGLRCDAEQGVAGACVCDPRAPTCGQGESCGLQPDGCGGEVKCGCAGGLFCGFAGYCAGDHSTSCSSDGMCSEANRPCVFNDCACATCELPTRRCGAFDDGCGTALACGDCADGERCDPVAHVCRPASASPLCFGTLERFEALEQQLDLHPESGFVEYDGELGGREPYGEPCGERRGSSPCPAGERCVRDACVRPARLLLGAAMNWDSDSYTSPARVELDSNGEPLAETAKKISSADPGGRGWILWLQSGSGGTELFFQSSKPNADWTDTEIFHAILLPYASGRDHLSARAIPVTGPGRQLLGDPAVDDDGVRPGPLLADRRTLLFGRGAAPFRWYATRRPSDDPGDERFVEGFPALASLDDLVSPTLDCDGAHLLLLRPAGADGSPARLLRASITVDETGVTAGAAEPIDVPGLAALSPSSIGLSADCRTLYVLSGDSRNPRIDRARACP